MGAAFEVDIRSRAAPFPGVCSVSGMRPGIQHGTARSVRLDQPVPLSRRVLCWVPDQVPLALHLSGKGPGTDQGCAISGSVP